MGNAFKDAVFWAATLPIRALDRYRRTKGAVMSRNVAAEPGQLYQFEVKTIDGKTKSLGDYKGQVLLIVNTASLCGFTPQYEGLEKLQREYGPKGLRILAFPANDFGSQEPGRDSEIKEFCRTRYSATFDLFSKITVKGPDMHPLYRFLTTESDYPGDIAWNFSKFLVDREGTVVGRFGPTDEPTGRKVAGKVAEVLGA